MRYDFYRVTLSCAANEIASAHFIPPRIALDAHILFEFSAVRYSGAKIAEMFAAIGASTNAARARRSHAKITW